MKVEITKRNKGGARKVLIDGKDVASRVLELEVNYKSKHLPTVSLILAPDELIFEDSAAENT